MTRDDVITKIENAENGAILAAAEATDDRKGGSSLIPIRFDPAMREFIVVNAKWSKHHGGRYVVKYTLRGEVISQLAAVLLICAYHEDDDLGTFAERPEAQTTDDLVNYAEK